MKTPHPIPYQGSKRRLAPVILEYFPDDVGTLFEPFAGSAAISLAAANRGLAGRFVINDLNDALIRLWDAIINEPEIIARKYQTVWKAQLGNERIYYDYIRDEFNATGREDYFLYLLVRCVKASVRYNANKEFNQSPDNRRKGTRPSIMQAEIIASSKILKGKSVLTAKHYRDSVSEANSSDLVYMDPPYQGVSQQRDSRYLEGISIADFIETLDELNAKKVSYIVSYDGRTGDKVIGKRLPSFLELGHIEINAGRSSQATLLGRSDITYESIYLSPVLKERLSSQKKERAAEEVIHQIERYMLLSGSANRAKSWSCEHCRNWIEYKSEDICGTCYWAYPEKYTHVAMEPVRRVDIIWSDQETAIFDQARADAEQSALNIQDYIKRLVRKHIEGKNTE